MIVDIVIFIIFVLMNSVISLYYVRKLWFIVKTMKYLKLQKILMEKSLQTEGQNAEYQKPDTNDDDPMFV